MDKAPRAAGAHHIEVTLLGKMRNQPPAAAQRLQIAIYELEFKVKHVKSLHRHQEVTKPSNWEICYDGEPRNYGNRNEPQISKTFLSFPGILQR